MVEQEVSIDALLEQEQVNELDGEIQLDVRVGKLMASAALLERIV